MEYIEGFDLRPDFARTLSIERQIDMVSSSTITLRATNNVKFLLDPQLSSRGPSP